MQTVRLFDPAREPQGWMQIIRPTQFAVFASFADSGATCDADANPTSAEDASCIIFDALPEAEAFCRQRVAEIPSLRFDIRDSAGLLRPPLFTIVHPSREAALDDTPQKRRWNTRVAIVLVLAAPVLIWVDWAFYGGVKIMPTMVGINALLIAIRLFVMNAGHAAAERARRERVENALAEPRANRD